MIMNADSDSDRNFIWDSVLKQLNTLCLTKIVQLLYGTFFMVAKNLNKKGFFKINQRRIIFILFYDNININISFRSPIIDNSLNNYRYCYVIP